MIRSPFTQPLLASLAIHLVGLAVVSLLWHPASFPETPANLIAAELVVITPSPPSPAEIAAVPPPPKPKEVKLPEPPKEITPPKIVEKTDLDLSPIPPDLQPLDERTVSPAPVKLALENPALPRLDSLALGPPPLPDIPELKAPQPGPPIPLPDEGPQRAPGNILGHITEVAASGPLQPVEGGEAGAGKLFAKGDVAVVPGTGTGGGSGGPGKTGLGLGASGRIRKVAGVRPGAGGEGPGGGAGKQVALARPLGGYQVKPRYPESARREGAQGVTLLKVRVLENGKVGEVLIEESAGHPELDRAAAEAVKKWRFEPARKGTEPVAVWVVLPVRFQLQ